MSTPALNPLVTKIRGAYPGVYDDMDDAALTKAVLAKYPQYSDLAAPPGPQRPQVNMQQVDITGKPQNPAAGMAGVPGGSANPQPASNTYAAAVGIPIAAAAAYMGGSAALPFLRQTAVQHPLATAMIASEAIHQGRENIPVVGRMIPSWAEMLPWILTGSKSEAKPAEPSARPPFLPKPAPPVENPTAAEAYTPGPRPVIQRGPIPGSQADLNETAVIKDQVRAAAEREAQTIEQQGRKEWFGRNQPGTTKGELTGTPEKPVKFTKTKGVKAAPPPGTIVPQANQDLVPLLEKALQQAKARTGG